MMTEKIFKCKLDSATEQLYVKVILLFLYFHYNTPDSFSENEKWVGIFCFSGIYFPDHKDTSSHASEPRIWPKIS